MYNEGKGVKQDFTKAVLWFCKAAEQGDASAQSNLGYIMYDHGHVVKRDYSEAVQWFRKAAKQGFTLALCTAKDMV